MTKFNEAQKLAIIKGGYDWPLRNGEPDYVEGFSSADMVLDPLFWQALGKALGWGASASDLINFKTAKRKKRGYEWQWHAMNYYLLNLTGGNEEKFWKQLISHE